MQTGLTIYVGAQRIGMKLSLRGSCTGPVEAAHLKQVATHVMGLGSRTLWIDCEHVAAVSTQGQQAILHIEQQAALAQVPVYWCGFSNQLIQELSATGLYGILRSLPATGYQDPEGIQPVTVVPFIA